MVSNRPRTKSLGRRSGSQVGLQTHNSTHHHDLSEAVITRYEENTRKLKEVFKANDQFVIEETELLNIITKAVMPDTVKEAVLTHNEIGQERFDKFVKERIVERNLSVWSPMRKAKLET